MAPYDEEQAKDAFWHVLGLYEQDRIVGSTWYVEEGRMCPEEQGQVTNQRTVECFCPVMALIRWMDETARCVKDTGPSSELVDRLEEELEIGEAKIMGFAAAWDERWEDYIQVHIEDPDDSLDWNGLRWSKQRWEMLEQLRPYFVRSLGTLLRLPETEIQDGLEATEAKLAAYLDLARE